MPLRRAISPRRLAFSVGQSKLRRGGVQPKPAASSKLSRIVRGEAVQLLRDAAEVDAGAAERGVLGDGDARAALPGHARGAYAAAAGTDDEQVEDVSGHARPKPASNAGSAT